MQDPLRLQGGASGTASAARSAAIANLFGRITSRDYADSLELRVQLLAHLIYLTYADLKETFGK
jgi:hypothetical protein